MNFNTPEEWKSESVLYPTTVKKDRYNCETVETATDGTVLRLAWRPVTDEATIEEYGIHHKGGIKAALFDASVSVKLFDIIVYARQDSTAERHPFPKGNGVSGENRRYGV